MTEKSEPINKSLIEKMKIEGYRNLTVIHNRGLCGLMRMAFTTGLFYGLNEFTYEGRYCFETTLEATTALNEWNGINDPTENWIKHKGSIEYSNPNYEK